MKEEMAGDGYMKQNHAYGGKGRMESTVKVVEKKEYAGTDPVLHL